VLALVVSLEGAGFSAGGFATGLGVVLIRIALGPDFLAGVPPPDFLGGGLGFGVFLGGGFGRLFAAPLAPRPVIFMLDTFFVVFFSTTFVDLGGGRSSMFSSDNSSSLSELKSEESLAYNRLGLAVEDLARVDFEDTEVFPDLAGFAASLRTGLGGGCQGISL
jgi:hypothetical protein